MKKITQALISLVMIFMLLPVAQAAPQEVVSFQEVKQYAELYNENISYIPKTVKALLKNERLNIYADNQVVGVATKDGAIEELRDKAFPKPTVNVYISQGVIRNIQYSEDPVNTALTAWKNEQITCKALTIRSKIKLFFASALLKTLL